MWRALRERYMPVSWAAWSSDRSQPLGVFAAVAIDTCSNRRRAAPRCRVDVVVPEQLELVGNHPAVVDVVKRLGLGVPDLASCAPAACASCGGLGWSGTALDHAGRLVSTDLGKRSRRVRRGDGKSTPAIAAANTEVSGRCRPRAAWLSQAIPLLM